jgi:hypothetical protein
MKQQADIVEKALDFATQNSLGRITKSVDPHDTFKAIGFIAPQYGQTDDFAKQVGSVLNRILQPHPENPVGVTADSAWQAQRYAQQTARNLFGLAKRGQGVNSVDVYGKALTWNGAYRELSNAIAQASRQSGVNMNMYKIPAVYNAIAEVNKQLADDIFKQNWTFEIVRSMKAPAVRASIIAEESLNNMASMWPQIYSNLTRRMTGAVAGAVAGGSVLGVPGAIGGGVGTAVALPVMEKITRSKMPQVATAVAKKLEKVAPTIKGIAEAGKFGKKYVAKPLTTATLYAMLRKLIQLPAEMQVEEGQTEEGGESYEEPNAPIPGTPEYFKPK